MTDVRRRILVVEDEVLLALDLAEILTAEGYQVIGPTGSVAATLKKIKEHQIDCAVLDVVLSDDMCIL